MPSDRLRSVKFKCPHCGKSISEELVKSHAASIAGKASAAKQARKRGPKFFRDLQKLRKNKAGGRPPNDSK